MISLFKTVVLCIFQVHSAILEHNQVIIVSCHKKLYIWNSIPIHNSQSEITNTN